MALAAVSRRRDDRTVRSYLFALVASVPAAALLVWTVASLGGGGVWFAFLIVWVPMAWLGTMSRVVQLRLPDRYHQLRGFEHDGRPYELLGVRLFKRLLRRGPLAMFNPDLHLPPERTPERLAHLDQRMKDAEASHFVLLVVMLGVVANAAAHGSWATAGWILIFDVLMNGYPVMLQRYNRALLQKRYPTLITEPTGGAARTPAIRG